MEESDIDSPDESNANPNRPLWRDRNYDLLTDDMSFFGRAKIVVCLPDEPFNEKNLGDTDAGVLFLSEGDLQMTSFQWPLAQVRLEGGRLLSEIITWCSEHAKSSGDDSGLEGLPKNPYCHVKRQELSTTVKSKLKKKSTDMEVQKVSSLRCCKYRCTQTFSWEDTLAVRQKFYSITFEYRREIAYAVQGQLHELPDRRKKFITLSNREVCENAWYIIHGISRSTYHKYKATAYAGRINGTHGNTRVPRPRAHTIQAEANFMTIIQENADRMPNEFRNIGKKQVNNLLVLPVALNWDHMRDISNSIRRFFCFMYFSVTFLFLHFNLFIDMYRELQYRWAADIYSNPPPLLSSCEQQSARCKLVSQSTVSVMKKKLFRHVEVKAPNNNFSRCTECDFLQDCISKYPRGCREWATLVNDRTKHINYQNACRRLYHGWRSNSVDSPTEFLCIIHDKMDHTKTIIPRMQRTTKATSGLEHSLSL